MENQLSMSCDESVVIISSIRYMLGRSSYGVGCVCNYVKSRKKDLSDSNKAIIEIDILDAIVACENMPYKQDWLDLIEYIKADNVELTKEEYFKKIKELNK